MDQILCDYDIYPMVFPAGKEITLTVKPLGEHARLPKDTVITSHALYEGGPGDRFTAWNLVRHENTVNDDGAAVFKFTAPEEGEYHLRFFDRNARMIMLCRVYALGSDLAGRYPLRGDFHMHSFRSDGHEDPAVVVANYRKLGYDFCTITDHGRYYPSLEAIRKYSGADIPVTILPGEEVHLCGTSTHIINAGGLFSVNGLFEYSDNYRDTAGSLEGRRFDSSVTPPDIVSDEQFEHELEHIKEEYSNCPDDIDKHSFAVCVWAYRKIREAGGLAVHVHPYWISDMINVPEKLNDYMMEKHPFDAFEVLGGENYYTQNGLQTAVYYAEAAKGRLHPIVGSTDTHGSTPHNPNYDICSTIVFAPKNEREDILQAVRDRWSVAVDTISKEYRLVGPYRLQKYALFLMEYFYPVHDRQAMLDGEILRRYYLGEENASQVAYYSERSRELMKKYILTSDRA